MQYEYITYKTIQSVIYFNKFILAMLFICLKKKYFSNSVRITFILKFQFYNIYDSEFFIYILKFIFFILFNENKFKYCKLRLF